MIAGKAYLAVSATQLADGTWRVRLLTMGERGRDSRTVHLFDSETRLERLESVLQLLAQAASEAALDVGNVPHVRL